METTGISAERIENVIETMRRRKEVRHVVMAEGLICDDRIRHPCGSPACVAGNYWLAKIWDGVTEYPKKFIGFNRGTDEMAWDLGFEHPRELRFWAKDNPTVWGNKHGWWIFTEPHAYTTYVEGKPFSMAQIITHWEGVLERFKAEQAAA